MWSANRPGMLTCGKCLHGSRPSGIPRLPATAMLLKNVMAGVSPPIVQRAVGHGPVAEGTGLWCVPCGLGSAVRLAAAALTGCQGRRCVWVHDFTPALDTAACDVDRCVVVGVPNEATPATLKLRLGAPVFLV